MQLTLSNLVDLALTSPHTNLDCENLNLLHTLLQIILKKLSLTETRIDLVDELADAADILMRDLPKEPSVTFSEFTIKAGDLKAKKKCSSSSTTVQKSLIQVSRNWPSSFCSREISEEKSRINNTVTELINSQTIQSRDSINKMNNKVETFCDSLNKKVSIFEKDIYDLKKQNCEVKEDLQNLKTDFVDFSEKFEEDKDKQIKSPLELPLDKPSLVSSNQESKIPQNHNRELSSPNKIEENSDAIKEINSIKERMLELSESLKLNSEFLKKLKCEELAPLMESYNDINEKIENIKSQMMSNIEAVKMSTSHEINGMMKEEIKSFERKISSQIESIENQVNVNKEMTCGEISSLRLDLIDKTSIASINQGSQTVCMEKISKSGDNRSKCKKHLKTKLTPHVSLISEDLHFNMQALKGQEIDVNEDDCIFHVNELSPDMHEPSKNSNSFSPCEKELHEQDVKVENICEKLENLFCDLKKQVMSQSICMQQIVRDLKLKVDKEEFDFYSREISDAIDEVLQLRKDLQSMPTASSCSVTLARKMNYKKACQPSTSFSHNHAPMKLRQIKIRNAKTEAMNRIFSNNCNTDCNNSFPIM